MRRLTLISAAVVERDDCYTQVTGHTATAALGSQMMVLGGGNKRQFHSCRHVPAYDPIERTWSRLSTRGNAPVALIYHRCAWWLCHTFNFGRMLSIFLRGGGRGSGRGMKQ